MRCRSSEINFCLKVWKYDERKKTLALNTPFNSKIKVHSINIYTYKNEFFVKQFVTIKNVKGVDFFALLYNIVQFMPNKTFEQSI